MAATLANARVLLSGAGTEGLTQVQASGLTAGATETIAHLGPTSVSPHSITVMVTTPPTDGSSLDWYWTNPTTSGTSCNIKFDCPAGGSLDGAVVLLLFRFLPVATGGLSTITTT